MGANYPAIDTSGSGVGEVGWINLASNHTLEAHHSAKLSRPFSFQYIPCYGYRWAEQILGKSPRTLGPVSVLLIMAPALLRSLLEESDSSSGKIGLAYDPFTYMPLRLPGPLWTHRWLVISWTSAWLLPLWPDVQDNHIKLSHSSNNKQVGSLQNSCSAFFYAAAICIVYMVMHADRSFLTVLDKNKMTSLHYHMHDDNVENIRGNLHSIKR